MEPNFEAVYSAGDEAEAGIIKGLLESNGIEATIISHHDSVYKIGEVEVYVNEDDAPLALEIINQREFE
jgi:hypothetical protein